jgi:hypothetical protein
MPRESATIEAGRTRLVPRPTERMKPSSIRVMVTERFFAIVSNAAMVLRWGQ